MSGRERADATLYEDDVMDLNVRSDNENSNEEQEQICGECLDCMLACFCCDYDEPEEKRALLNHEHGNTQEDWESPSRSDREEFERSDQEGRENCCTWLCRIACCRKSRDKIRDAGSGKDGNDAPGMYPELNDAPGMHPELNHSDSMDAEFKNSQNSDSMDSELKDAHDVDPDLRNGRRDPEYSPNICEKMYNMICCHKEGLDDPHFDVKLRTQFAEFYKQMDVQHQNCLSGELFMEGADVKHEHLCEYFQFFTDYFIQMNGMEKRFNVGDPSLRLRRDLESLFLKRDNLKFDEDQDENRLYDKLYIQDWMIEDMPHELLEEEGGCIIS